MCRIFDAIFLSFLSTHQGKKVHLLVMQLKTPTEGDTVGPLLVLCLHPLNGWAREPKRIPLTVNPVVIGQHTSVKTAPKETNGFFSAKVLSRAHAEVWAAGGKVCVHGITK